MKANNFLMKRILRGANQTKNKYVVSSLIILIARGMKEMGLGEINDRNGDKRILYMLTLICGKQRNIEKKKERKRNSTNDSIFKMYL